MGWMFPRALYLELAESTGVAFDLQLLEEPLIFVETNRIRHLLVELFTSAEHLRSEALLLYEQTILFETLRCLQCPVVEKGLRGRASIAESIRLWLHDHRTPVTMVDLCREFGLPERTLRHYFTREFDVSPVRYHLALRLNSVRQQLLAAAPFPGAVSQAATENGFWHMGRFGQQYRSVFGETPQDTIGRKRVRQPAP